MEGARVSLRKSKGQHPSKEAAHREREAMANALHSRSRQAGAVAGKSRSSSPYAPSSRSSSPGFTSTILGAGHKIARGRGRKKQLDLMTEEQKSVEREIRMEKMRLAARECRARKKLSVQGLEQRLAEYRQQDEKNRDQIADLQGMVRQLQVQLHAAQQSQLKFGVKPEPSQYRGAATAGHGSHGAFGAAAAAHGEARHEDNGHTVPQQVPQQQSAANSYGQTAPIEFPFSFGEMDCLG